MRTVSYKLADLGKVVIHLGKMAENDATRVQIDAGQIFAEYPDAVPSLTLTNPDSVSYPAVVVKDGNNVIWDVKDSDLAVPGTGEFQLTFTDNGTVVKSCIGRTKICRSITGGGTAPDPVQDWLDHANEVLAETGDALETLENMTASASALPAGSNPTATYHNGNIAFGIPKGDKGDTGAAGQNGVTPNLIAGTTTTGAAGTSASVTRRAGSPDSAPIFDFTIPKGDKGDHGDLQLDSTLTSASAAAPADQVGNLKSAINSMPTEETGQELLAAEFHNTGLTDTAIMVLGMILNAMPQDDIATDIMHSISLECERLNAIYENWMSERSA